MERVYRNIYTNTCSFYNSDVYNSDSLLDTNTTFNKYLFVDLTKQYIEFPVCLRSFVISTILEGMKPNRKKFDKIVTPLYVCGQTINRSTYAPAIKDFFSRSLFSNRLTKIVKGDKAYYGMGGLIMDSSFNILVLCTSTFNIVKENTKPIKYIKSNIYVHPNVFIDTKDFINKGIVSKMIPFYLSDGIPTRHIPSVDFPLMINPEISIKDVTKEFLFYPDKPEVRPDINNVLNQVLIDNLSDVEYLIKQNA